MKISIKYRCVLLFALLAGIQTMSWAGNPASSWRSKIDPVVLRKADAGNLQEFVVVMQEQADVSAANRLDTKEEKGLYVYKTLTEVANRTQGEATALLDELKVPYQRFWVVNSLLVHGDATVAAKLAALTSVSGIIENAAYTSPKPLPAESTGNKVAAVEWNLTKVKADQVWALGYKGQGVVIGGQDTGYQWDHPAIKNQYRGWDGSNADHNYNWHDAIHTGTNVKCGVDSKAPCDDEEHGTHTMGTMVGNDGGSNQIGMAPSAKWIGCKNMNSNVGTLASYVECFQWFLAPTDLNNANPEPRKAPHVINNSWGCDDSEGCNSSTYPTMETALDNLRASGVVVVVSAGNSGPSCSTINTAAAIYKGAFSVGSTTSSDAISSFSSRGPVTVYGPSRMGPDISAPGSSIRSSVPGNGYASMSGTSMAGPHVAGLVALMISANPNLAGKVDLIESIIQQTAVQLTTSESCGGSDGSKIPNNTFGYGRIDALAAIKKAISASVLEITSNTATVSAYPNPFTQKVSFRLNNWKAATASIQLYTLTGQQLLSEQWNTLKPSQEVDLSALPAGVYFYSVSNGTQNIQGKLVKTN